MKNRVLLMLLFFAIICTISAKNSEAAPPDKTEGFLEYQVKQVHKKLKMNLTRLAYSKNSAAAMAPCLVAPDAIGGIVFVDLNANGTAQASETGRLANVIVELYDCNGNLAGSTTTDANGEWTITGLVFGGTDDIYRLEYSLNPAQISEGYSVSLNAETSVQLIAASGCNYDFGVMDVPNYCQLEPDFAMNCYVEGSNVGSGLDVLISLNHVGATVVDHEATGGTIGTTFGLAYQKASKNLFAAAFQKRFSGYGSGSPGSIYIVSNPGDGIYSGSLFVDLNTLFGSPVAGVDPHDFVTTNAGGDILDGNSFDAVGRVGFGDMDITEDQLSLWTVNLNDRSLYRIPLGADPLNPVPPTMSSEVDVIPLADPLNPLPDLPAGITNDEIIPFATKCRKGLVYFGLVTNGQDGGPMFALAYSYNPVSGTFTKVLEFDLNYSRGCGFASSGTCFGQADWNPWTTGNVFPNPTVFGFDELGYPQPVFTDIEFDAAGNMLIGLRDRLGDQGGYDVPTPNGANYTNPGGVATGLVLAKQDAFGDILKANSNGSGGFNLNAADFEDTSNSIATPSGSILPCPPGENIFGDDCYHADGYLHEETTMGGFAIHPGYNNLVVSVMDPLFNAFSNGVDWFDMNSNSLQRSHEVLTGGVNSDFGKSYGLGDIEFICAQAPIQIGNVVWIDEDNDGVQDPCEALVSGVRVQLYKMDGAVTTLVDSKTTDANGKFLFTDYEEYGAGFDTLTPGMDYFIVLGEGGEFNTGSQVLTYNSNPYQLGQANIGEGSNSNFNDSDASLVNDPSKPFDGFPAIMLTIPGAGYIDHNFDFGLAPMSDYGDLPDSYNTLTGSNGPSHILNNDLYLGSCADADADGQPETMAGRMMNGDDNQIGLTVIGTCSGDDDEDGIQLLTPLIPGETACVLVTTHNNMGVKAYLTGWIDFDGDGSFGAGEQLLFDQMIPAVTDAEVPFGDNTLPYCFVVPANAVYVSGNAFMRFRISTEEGLSFEGAAPDGEVEDYKFPLGKLGNYVWTDANFNGIQDEAGTGINGVELKLTWAGLDNDILTTMDNLEYFTTTSNMNGVPGGYMFSGIVNGTYQLEVSTPPVGLSPTTPYAPGSNYDNNSDYDYGTPIVITDVEAMWTGESGISDNNGASGYPDNQEDLSFDFGYIPPCSIEFDEMEMSDCMDNRYSLTVTLTFSGVTGDIEIQVGGQPFFFTPVGTSGTESFVIQKLTCMHDVLLPVTAWSVDNPSCEADPPLMITPPCPDKACVPSSVTKN
ncbi:MAG: SdrD B-like domain-containing protein [Saprospiraceae bacterium]